MNLSDITVWKNKIADMSVWKNENTHITVWQNKVPNNPVNIILLADSCVKMQDINEYQSPHHGRKC